MTQIPTQTPPHGGAVNADAMSNQQPGLPATQKIQQQQVSPPPGSLVQVHAPQMWAGARGGFVCGSQQFADGSITLEVAVLTTQEDRAVGFVTQLNPAAIVNGTLLIAVSNVPLIDESMNGPPTGVFARRTHTEDTGVLAMAQATLTAFGSRIEGLEAEVNSVRQLAMNIEEATGTKRKDDTPQPVAAEETEDVPPAE